MYQILLIQPQQGAQISINRKCGLKGGPILSTILMIITATTGTIIFIEVGYVGSPISQIQTEWIITSNLLNIEWTQVFDSQTASMQIPVLYISAQVQQYSQNYMSTDPHISRFFSYLDLICPKHRECSHYHTDNQYNHRDAIYFHDLKIYVLIIIYIFKIIPLRYNLRHRNTN